MSASNFDFEIAGRPDEVDLRGIGSAIGLHKSLIGGATLGAMALALIFCTFAKPRYMAESRILVENQESYFTGAGPQPRDAAPVLDSEAINSQVQLLTSRDLARKAVKTLGLQGNPEFDPAARGFSALTRPLILLGLIANPADSVVEDRLLTAFFDHLAVYSPTKTRVLQVEFSSQDPDLAAKGANVIADLYIDLQMQAKRDSAHQAVQTLKPLIASLEARVARADAQVEAFRAKNGLFEGANNTNVSTQQLGEINAQLAQARGAQSDAQARAHGLRETLQHGHIGDVGDIANNELVRRIAEQRVALRSQLAMESRTLLPGHPRIKELDAQLSDNEGQLRAAVERAARSLENDARVAAARVANLSALLDEQKQTVGASNADETQLRELQRVAKTLKDQLESESAKYQADLARDASDAAPADARIISRALSPSTPVFPKIAPITIFATLAGLFFSIGYVVVRELVGFRPAPTTRLAPAPPRELPDHFAQAVPKATAKVAAAKPAIAKPDAPPVANAALSNVAIGALAWARARVAFAPESSNPPSEQPLRRGLRLLKEAVARFSAPAVDGGAEEGEAISQAAASARPEKPRFAAAEKVAAKPAMAPPQAAAPNSWATIGHPAEDASQSAVGESVSPAKGRSKGRTIVSRALVERLAPLSRHGGAKVLLVGAADPAAAAGAHLALARSMAREGRAVLVQLDGDDNALRRALVPADAEGGDARIGLAQLLKGEASFAEVIYRDAFSRLHIVLAGGAIESPEPGLRLILDALEHTYDIMLIVAPHDAIGESLAAEADLVLIFGEAGAARDFVHDDFAAAGAREIMLADVDLQGEIVESAA